MSETIYTIYALVCRENGKAYVGATKGFKRRTGKHFSNLRGNSHVNKELQADFNLYGEQAFEMQAVSTVTKKGVDEAERFYVELFTFTNGVYNVRGGGVTCKGHTEEAKRKISEANKGKTLSEETKRKIGEAQVGSKNHLSKITNEQAREIYLNTTDTQTALAGHYGVAIMTISDIQTGKSYTNVTAGLPQHPKHEARLNGTQVNKKRQVAQFTLEGRLVKVYPCIGDVKNYGFARSNVIACCKGRLKTHGGYVWKYYNEQAV